MISRGKRILFELVVGCLMSHAAAQEPGELIFETDLGGNVYPPALAPNGQILAATKSLFGGTNRLVALNPDGSIAWAAPLPTFGATHPVVADEGRIYVGAGDQNLHAFALDGTPLWQFPIGSQIFSAPALAADGTLYICAANVNKVFAVNPDGTQKWEFFLGGPPGVPVVGKDGAIHVGVSAAFFSASRLLTLSPEGVKKWEIPVSSGLSPIAVGDEGIVYTAIGGTFHAFQADGAPLWQTALGAGLIGPLSIAPDGTIYVPRSPSGGGGQLVALNPDGTEKWRFTPDEGAGGSTAVGKDGSIYYNTSTRFHCLGPDGRIQWSHPLRGFIGAPLLVEDRVYIGGENRFLAFHASSGPAKSPWPTFQHDAQRSGRAGGTTVFQFARHPQDQSVPELGRAGFSVEVVGANVTYQWRHNGAALAGETRTELVLAPVRSRDAGTYDVIVTHPDGVGASAPAELTVLPVEPFVERQLPEGIFAETRFTVALRATPPELGAAYAVEDRPPEGWQVGTINENGFYDPQAGKVKFGPFFDSLPRELTYELRPPIEGDARVNPFTGQASVEGIGVPIIGDSAIDLEALLFPADLNPADNRISVDEATAYGAAWRRGEPWPVDPNPIPIEYATRAGTLWKGGERYFHTDNGTDPVLRWVNRAGPRPMSLAGLRTASSPPTKAPRVVAVAPDAYVPGRAFRVSVFVEPAPDTRAFALEEQFPNGWAVTEISHGGAADSVQGRIRWGPFLDTNARAFTYEIRPPTEANGEGAFAGRVSFDGVNVPVFRLGTLSPGFALGLVPDPKGGPLQLRLDTAAEATYRIDVSDDLGNWLEWARVTSAQGNGTIDLPSPSASGQRFFRAVRVESAD